MRQRGFTILELLIALAIVAGLAFVAGGWLQKARGSKLRTATGEVASSLRWAFDRSLATGKHHRVAVRIDKGQWWIERCERKMPLRRGTDAEEEQEREEKAEEERLARAAEELERLEQPPEDKAEADKQEAEDGPKPPPECSDAPPVSEDGAEMSALAPPCCRPKGGAGKLRKLKRGLSFVSVDTAHLKEKAEKGEVKINFFAAGYAEKSVILLHDGDADKTWSITLEPLTGRVRVMTRPPKDDEGGAVHHDVLGQEEPEK